jgi:hypothetical protein
VNFYGKSAQMAIFNPANDPDVSPLQSLPIKPRSKAVGIVVWDKTQGFPSEEGIL